MVFNFTLGDAVGSKQREVKSSPFFFAFRARERASCHGNAFMLLSVRRVIRTNFATREGADSCLPELAV